MTIDRKTRICLQSLTFMMFCQKEEMDHVLGNHKVHVITLCQLDELRERMLIVRRFRVKQRLWFFNFVVILN